MYIKLSLKSLQLSFTVVIAYKQCCIALLINLISIYNYDFRYLYQFIQKFPVNKLKKVICKAKFDKSMQL